MPNRLQFEQSPYLLQHRENPVDWRPWGSEAFQTAREEDKPVFLSIGYSTCHWCHVMAHESFQDGKRDVAPSSGIGDVYKIQILSRSKSTGRSARMWTRSIWPPAWL